MSDCPLSRRLSRGRFACRRCATDTLEDVSNGTNISGDGRPSQAWQFARAVALMDIPSASERSRSWCDPIPVILARSDWRDLERAW
jgi:hypothetical protein